MMSEETPDYLIPSMGDLPVSSARYYQTATITSMPGRAGESSDQISGPMAVPPPKAVNAGAPAEGVLLTHRQSWMIQGTALGPLKNSICLAPGEITQIAVQNNSRQVMQDSVDTGILSDQQSRSGSSQSSLSEEQKAQAAQSNSGSSFGTSSATSSEAGAGGIAGLLGVSAGGSTNSSSSFQAGFSVGNRSISESASQSLHQVAQEQANLSRAKQSSSVREVSESSSSKLSSRVIVNYNHMHALTMQYFEVEQVYQLTTEVTDAERLLFVPMQSIDFSNPERTQMALEKFPAKLAMIATELNLPELAAKISLNAVAPEGMKELSDQIDQDLANSDATLAKTRESITEATTSANQLSTRIRSLEKALAEDKTIRNDQSSPEVVELKRAKQEHSELLYEGERLTEDLETLQKGLTSLRERQIEIRLAQSMGDREVCEQMAWHNRAFNQGLWMKLDPTIVIAMLRRHSYGGSNLGETIDPTPVAVAGDYVGFRWGFTSDADEKEFKAQHLGRGTVESSVSLPTGGLFGEAVLGQSNGAEKIDLTRFWNWKDALPPIRPAEIDALSNEINQPPLQQATPAQIQQSQLQTGPLEFQNVASGIPSISAALKNPELFRDMSGKETTSALSQSALQLASEGSQAAANLASENFKRFLSFQETVASTFLDSTKGASIDPTLAGGVLNAKTGKTDSSSDDFPNQSGTPKKVPAKKTTSKKSAKKSDGA